MTHALCRRCHQPILTVTVRRRQGGNARLRLEPDPHPEGTHVPHPNGWSWTYKLTPGIGLAAEGPAHRVHVCEQVDAS